ncbi:MAG: hypothetical protein WCK78_07580 [Paludibacter sp.]
MKTIRVIMFFVILFGCGILKAENIKETNADSTQLQKVDSSKTKQLYLVTKLNKVEYVCEILSDDGREVLILTDNLGKIYIPKSDIGSIEKIKDKNSVVRGEYYDAGPFTTRYSFTTNGFPLKKGSNYAIINLDGPEVHFAVTDNFSVGIMSTWIASPFVFVLKQSFKSSNENVHYSVGTLLGTSGYLGNFDIYGGLPFANVTFGNVKNNLTISVGYGFLGSFSDSKYSIGAPILSIAGITKVGAKASFIFDSMFGFITSTTKSDVYSQIFPFWSSAYTTTKSFGFCLMPGMRFQTKENSAFQVSLAGVSIYNFETRTPVTFPMPMCTWFYKF